MRYAVTNQLGVVLSRHDEVMAAQQQAMFFHAATRLPYSVHDERLR